MTNNKQSSSVEWLIIQLQKSKDWHRVLNEVSQMSSSKVDIIAKAKAMHKEEIVNTWSEATSLDYEIGLLDASYILAQVHNAEQYYNETFGGNNEQQ